MNERGARWLIRVIQAGIFLLIGFYILAFIAVSFKRLLYPYELEWIEGGFLVLIHRIRAGLPLYTRPTLEYIPFIYPPVYYYLTAGMAYIVGPNFTALRVISFTSALFSLLLIMTWVHKEGDSVFAALSAGGFFAGTYRLSGTWFDVGRVDSLFVFFLLVGMYVLIHHPSPTRSGVAGVLLFLGAMTKQTALPILAPVFAFLVLLGVLKRGRFVWITLGTFVGLLVLAELWFNWRTHGWFWYYTVTIPRGFPVLPHALWRFWKDDVFPYVTLAFVTSLLFLWQTWANVQWSKLSWYGIFFASVFLNTWVVRSHRGSYLNDLIPFHAVLALGFGLWIAYVQKLISNDVWKRGPVVLIVFLQLLALLYNPKLVVPNAQHVVTGNEVVSKIATFNGPVLVPFHPYLAMKAGKPPHMHIAAAYDVLRSDPEGWGQRLREETRAALREQRFSAVILDQPLFWLMDETTERLLRKYYEGPLPLVENPDAFRPLTGLRLRPEALYVKKAHRPNNDR